MHFADVEDLMEDEGLDREDAEHFTQMAEETAKTICSACPVRDKCRDTALVNDERWGIWGGMTTAERDAARPEWLAMKEGLPSPLPAIRKDLDALHINPGSHAKLARRNERARIARDLLLQKPADWATESRKEGRHVRDEHLAVCELILANPDVIAEDLMRRQGKRGEYLNKMMREMCRVLEIA